MNKIVFEDGTKTQESYVEINGENYQVTPAVWTGNTPLKSFNLNNMQDNIEEAINEVDTKYNDATTTQREVVILENTVNANTNYTIPLNYKVNSNSLEVFYCGEKLQKRS